MAHITVLGAGFGGIATAIRQRARGHTVDVYEGLAVPGGRARFFEHEGICFDAGPTVITAPFLLDELFQLAKCKREDHVELVPVKPWYRYLLADGRHFDYGCNADEVLANVTAFSPEDREGYIKLRNYCAALYREGYEKRGAQAFHQIREMLRAIPALLKLRADRSVFEGVSHFIKDPALREILSVHPLLVGGHPFRTSSIYMLIHHLEQAHGVWYVKGGTTHLVKALVTAAESMGVNFHFEHGVKSVDVSKGRVRKINFENNASRKVDLLVSNLDPVMLYGRYWKSDKPKKKWGQKKLDGLRHSMGLYVLYFATNHDYRDVAHHTIVLDQPYKSQLDNIFDGAGAPEIFSAYLHRPKATDPAAGPEGMDPMYVLVPVPNLENSFDWKQHEPIFRKRVIEFLEKRCLPGLEKNLRFAFSVTPEYFANDLQSSHGSGFSIHPDLLQSAYFRFHNKSEEAENLYLVGSGTHPGAGVPGVLTSAKILDQLIAAASHE
jgi:phytoene desaturase